MNCANLYVGVVVVLQSEYLKENVATEIFVFDFELFMGGH